MKRIPLVLCAFFLGAVTAALAAAPALSYEKKPLPPGPVLNRAPDYSSWRMVYSFANPVGTSSSSNPSGPAGVPDPHLPKALTVTQTKPLWHAVLVDVGGEKQETWFDGATRFEQVSPSQIIPISNNHGKQTGKFLSGREDFPDVDWVSPNTYLGTEKDTGYWIFQETPDGAMVWIDSVTHYPVRWTKGNQIRTFEFLSPPTDPLTLPPAVARISQALKRLDALSRLAPSGL